MTRVVWIGERAGCWDQHLLDRILSGPGWEHETFDPADAPEVVGAGAVVIVPARFHTAYEVNVMLAGLPWVVVVLTSDEESTFEHSALNHPNQLVWVMTPQPGLHEPGVRYIGEGSPDPSTLAAHATPPPRAIDVQFAGQVTHERREQMRDAVHQAMLRDGPRWHWRLLATQGFTQGMARLDYLDQLAFSRVVLAPSGPATPDSFRAYEALEAGAVPIVDGLCPRYPERGYWDLVYPRGVPFPVVHDWADELAKTVEHVLSNWRPMATRCQAWWLQQQRQLRSSLADDVRSLCARGEAPWRPEITALVPTSPTSDGPAAAFERLDRTVRSITDRLPAGTEVIVMCDGVRAEQEHLREQYEEFLGMVTWAAAHHWRGVTPLVFDHHAHQANMAREALELVETPCVLYVEHDMPLVGETPFGDLAALVRSGFANVVRLGQDREREQYAELMLEHEPRHEFGARPARAVPVVRTVQWSQRPHLASTGFYRQMLGSYFGTRSRTMIEDVMHGVVQNAYRRHGEAGWEQFRVVFYAPGGDETRSVHLDGRGDDPKYPMVYAYDGPTPEGAPQPTVSQMERLRRGEHLSIVDES